MTGKEQLLIFVPIGLIICLKNKEMKILIKPFQSSKNVYLQVIFLIR